MLIIRLNEKCGDKSPLFLDSTCPLSQAYHQLAAKKANRAKLMEETMRKKRK